MLHRKILLSIVFYNFSMSLFSQNIGVLCSCYHDKKEICFEKQLKNAKESSDCWREVANNPDYSKERRRLAVFRLFKAHVKKGVTLKQLANILLNPSWFDLDDILVIEALGGSLPVRLTVENTVL